MKQMTYRSKQTSLFEIKVKDMTFDQYNAMIREKKKGDFPNQAGIKILADMVKNGYNPLKPIVKK